LGISTKTRFYFQSGTFPGCRYLVSRDIQRRLFAAALDELATAGEPVNRVLEVDIDGDEITLTLYEWSSTTT
jgi:hypothetical protein